MEETFYTYHETPVDRLLLAGGIDALTLIVFQGGKKARMPEPDWKESAAPFREAIRQLDSYFAGELKEFDLPLSPQGTPFQMKVWGELRKIPYGGTCSYGEIARRVGSPGASRAVGAANGANPLPIVVPCHRVIGGNGSLTGFGGGLPVKEALLNLEQGYVPGGQMVLGIASDSLTAAKHI